MLHYLTPWQTENREAHRKMNLLKHVVRFLGRDGKRSLNGRKEPCTDSMTLALHLRFFSGGYLNSMIDEFSSFPFMSTSEAPNAESYLPRIMSTLLISNTTATLLILFRL